MSSILCGGKLAIIWTCEFEYLMRDSIKLLKSPKNLSNVCADKRNKPIPDTILKFEWESDWITHNQDSNNIRFQDPSTNGVPLLSTLIYSLYYNFKLIVYITLRFYLLLLFLFVLLIICSIRSHCSVVIFCSLLNSPANCLNSPPSRITVSELIQLA